MQSRSPVLLQLVRFWLRAGFVCLGLPLAFAVANETEPTAIAEAAVDFNRDIRPILSDTCYTCHGPDQAQRKSDLRLDVEESAFADLGGYRAVVPKDLEKSELYRRITSADPDVRMPPPDSGRQLTEAQVALIRRWIEEGAVWGQHWSLVPPKRPALPATRNTGWARNATDRFVLARLEGEGLEPSPEATKETLIRRVTLDLTGLPPAPEEIDAYLADDSPDAYEKVVDRLLASPRYGERMVLEWLDAARYADSNGYQTDGTRAMWPWRDATIRALNANMPFDQFTIEQIAGDMLPNATLDQKVASGFNRNHMLNGEGGRIAEESRVEYVIDRVETTATVWLGLTAGCARCHDHKYDPLSQKEFYQLYAYFNNLDESGAVDRRSSTAAPTIDLPTDEQKSQQASLQQEIAEVEPQLKAVEEQLRTELPAWEQSVASGEKKVPENIAALVKIAAAERTPEQAQELAEFFFAQSVERQKLKGKRDRSKKSLDQINNSVLITMVMQERAQPRETFILDRGLYDKPGEKVTAGVPACLPPLPEGAPNNRLGLARWLVDPANPLTARVTVNRFWQMFFGTGLVKTTEDFGSQGELPTHPELLDWLAVEFKVAGTLRVPSADGPNGSGATADSQSKDNTGRLEAYPTEDWNLKALQRLIVTSATYRQTSRMTPALLERDPENRLLARGPRYRLPSAVIRDQALALGGLLVERTGGPPVKPYQPAGIWEDFSFGKIVYKQDNGADLYRRSLYVFWRRSVGPTTFFDTPARQVCTVRQPRTNTPLHSLILLNDIAYVEAARALAERMMTEGGDTPEGRIAWAFQAATARQPRAAEMQVLLGGFERVVSHYEADPEAATALVSVGDSRRNERLDAAQLAAYTGIAGVILNLDEVITKE